MEISENILRNIQWFPGHMAQTRRVIKRSLSEVDCVAEILDARIPESSRNPEMRRMIGKKARIFVLNRADLADENITAKWIEYYKNKGIAAVACNSKSGKGIKNFENVLKTDVLRDLISQRAEKGMVGSAVRIMVAGIPNVGKSSFINKIAGSKKAKVENRPGVTRQKQWIRLDGGIELMDLPGILWPKFDDQTVAVKLAFTGAINEDIIDNEGLAMMLLETLKNNFPKSFERYKFVPQADMTGLELLEECARKRGMLLKGGIPDTERASKAVLDDFRSGSLGRISLENPQEFKR